MEKRRLSKMINSFLDGRDFIFPLSFNLHFTLCSIALSVLQFTSHLIQVFMCIALFVQNYKHTKHEQTFWILISNHIVILSCLP